MEKNTIGITKRFYQVQTAEKRKYNAGLWKRICNSSFIEAEHGKTIREKDGQQKRELKDGKRRVGSREGHVRLFEGGGGRSPKRLLHPNQGATASGSTTLRHSLWFLL
jgi:hypothetical protein